MVFFEKKKRVMVLKSAFDRFHMAVRGMYVRR